MNNATLRTRCSSIGSSSVYVAALAVAFLVCCRTVYELPAAGCVLAFSPLSRCLRGPTLVPLSIPTQQHLRMTFSYRENFNSDDDEEEDEDDDDESIDPASLGDWRTFRRNLLASFADDSAAIKSAEEPFTTTKTTKGTSSSSSSSFVSPRQTLSVSKENEDILRTQCEKLAQEYIDGVWAHPTSTVRHNHIHTVLMICLLVCVCVFFSNLV